MSANAKGMCQSHSIMLPIFQVLGCLGTECEGHVHSIGMPPTQGVCSGCVSHVLLHSTREPLELAQLPSSANNALYSQLYKEAAVHVRLRILFTLPARVCHSAWKQCQYWRYCLKCAHGRWCCAALARRDELSVSRERCWTSHSALLALVLDAVLLDRR